MQKLSASQLAEIAGVSVRTLHYYDSIGLLKPAERTEANYRFYGEAELLRLQQILLYRELDFSLEKIADILDDPGFDLVLALQAHKTELQKRMKRVGELVVTVENTIQQLKERSKKMDYNEMYKGFDPEKAKAYEKEAREKYGDAAVDDSHNKIKAMTKGEFDDLNKERENINKELAQLMHMNVDDRAIQRIVQRHFDLTAKFMDLTLDRYRGLGKMYVDDERFKEHYDKVKPGLAEYLRDAIFVYCEKNK
ncbi:MAG TPA: MerR family transcriptional regulator [Flavobacteriales bacterium]|nr:MerR family transcriptional regulator [Flavobacteriales bacterium]